MAARNENTDLVPLVCKTSFACASITGYIDEGLEPTKIYCCTFKNVDKQYFQTVFVAVLRHVNYMLNRPDVLHLLNSSETGADSLKFRSIFKHLRRSDFRGIKMGQITYCQIGPYTLLYCDKYVYRAFVHAGFFDGNIREVQHKIL